jgi:hypothetical protein
VEPPLANWVVEREMRELRARLEVMEAVQRRAPNTRDISNAKSKRGSQHKHTSHEKEGTPKRSQERIGDAIHCGEDTQIYPYKYFDG